MGRQAGTSRAAVLLGLLVFLAAGCGSSHPAASTTTTSTTSTTAATTTSAKPSLSLLTSGNCRELLGLSQSFAQAMEGNTQNLEKSAQLVQQFADKTPAAIRPDFEVLAGDWAKVAAALKGVNLASGKAPSASVMARLVMLSSKLDTQQLTQASQDITAWAHTNCGTTSG